jgi:hypothetical protein
VQIRAQPDHLGEPVELIGLRSLVIRDDHGNPLIVAQKLEEGVTVIYRHDEPSFVGVLKALGIGLNTRYTTGLATADVFVDKRGR